MVIGIRKGSRAHLYIDEWMEYRGLSKERLADRLAVSKPTVYRWASEQHRLTPDKIAGIADALDIEPADLFRMPGRRSIDALAKNASDADFDAIFDMAQRWMRRG